MFTFTAKTRIGIVTCTAFFAMAGGSHAAEEAAPKAPIAGLNATKPAVKNDLVARLKRQHQPERTPHGTGFCAPGMERADGNDRSRQYNDPGRRNIRTL